MSQRAGPESALVIVLMLGLVGACTLPAPGIVGPVAFDSATVWFHQLEDSVPLRVEVARDEGQHERGLSGRAQLDEGSGMMFLFDGPRASDDGFWMWGTAIPLDIAFIDEGGVIRRILEMEPCMEADPDDCAPHFPGVGYASAIETNRGWFQRHGLREGARARVVR